MDTQLQTDLRAFLNDAPRREAALLSAGYQGSAFLYEENGSRLVIKQAAGGLFGWFHQRMLNREARVYALLAEVPGVLIKIAVIAPAKVAAQ